MNDKLKKIRKSIEDSFGKGSVFLLNDEEHASVDVVPTGIMSLDNALGCGGIPRGRIIEFIGESASGKTSMALNIVAQFQKQGLATAFVDVEHALDISLASTLGVNVDEMFVLQPSSMEEAWQQIEELTKTGDVGVIVLDSIAALVPQAEIDGTFSDSQMGLQARGIGKAMRKLTGMLAKTNTTLVCLNQYRQAIGVFFGDNRVPCGGKALTFFASLRLEVSKSSQVKDGETPIGHTMNIKVLKNKLAVPFKKVAIPVVYGRGFDLLGDIVNFAVEKEVITVTGTTYSFKGEKIAVGLPRTKKNIAENKELLDNIIKELNK